MTERTAQGGNTAIVAPSGATFKITDTNRETLMFQFLLCQKKMTQNF